MSSNAQKHWVIALLSLAIAVVHAQVLGHEFINLDDDQYVTGNAQVRAGLTAHVEPVAWVSERKDVLSTLFMLLTLSAYLRYCKRESPRSFIWVGVFFALGLGPGIQPWD
jgi:hypothetical protein